MKSASEKSPAGQDGTHPIHLVCDVPHVGDVTAYDDCGMHLVAGGQGRSGEEVKSSASAIVDIVLVALVFGGLGLLVWGVA